MKALFKYPCLVMIALLITELFLNIICSPTILQSKWFTGNIHTKDSTYKFMFTPHYDGWMRNHDRVFLKKLQLDENGFRLPAIHASPEQNVVLIGGYSMIFSYGLEDSEALPRFISQGLNKPSSVYNTAWPGFDNYKNFELYQEKLEQKISPSTIIFSFFDEDLSSLYRKFLNHKARNETVSLPLFSFDDHHVILPPKNLIAKKIGWSYWNSLVAFELSNKLDDQLVKYFEYKSNLKNYISKQSKVEVSQEEEEEEEEEAQLSATKTITNTNAELTAEQQFFTQYITDLHHYFESRNQTVLFTFLPINGAPRNHYDQLTTLIPVQIPFIDINKTVDTSFFKHNFIAQGHYSKIHCQKIAKLITAKLNGL